MAFTRTSVKRVEWTAQVTRCGCGDPKRLHRNGLLAQLRGEPKYVPCPNPQLGESFTTSTARCYDCGDHDAKHGDGTPYHIDRECRLEGTSNQEHM